MRYILVILLVIVNIVSYAQSYRSEIIQYTSLNQVKGDKLIRTDSVVLQINERMGDYDAEIFIPYSKGDKVSIENAHIEDLSGNVIRKLKNKDIEDRSFISDISLYSDDYVKSFNLKHSVYPYRIVYSYKITYSKFINAIALDYTEVKQPVKSGKIILETSINEPILFKQNRIDVPLVDTLSDVVCYTWHYSHTPLLQEVNRSLNDTEAPLIYAIPAHFKYGIEGSNESWQTFGNWIFRLNQNKDNLPLAEQEKISNLIAGIDGDKEKARLLYKYLQDHTRYINVSIKLGGLQTYPASYVSANGYGDCKALTNYMQTILKYAGIKSYYTLIKSGKDIIDTDPKYPSQAFDHVILTIPFGKDTTYLECTSKNTPFGYMGTFTQGRKALLIDETNSHLINIPALTLSDVLCHRDFRVDLNTSEIELLVVEKGIDYENTNYLASEVNQNIVNKYIRNNILSGSYDLHDFKIEKESRDSAEINMKVNSKIHNLYKEYGKNLIITPFPIKIPLYESPEKRTTNLQLDYPEHYKDCIIYQLAGRVLSKIPEDVELDSVFGRYSLTFAIKDDLLIVNKEIIVYSGRYSKSQYPDFYKFIISIKNNEQRNYYLELL